mgnify:CR=1 FL=1
MAEEESNESTSSDDVEEADLEGDTSDAENELDDLKSSMTEERTEIGDTEAEEQEEEDEKPQPPVLKHEGRFYGTGRRKQSVARVWISAGEGTITVNDREYDEYFNHRRTWHKIIRTPLDVLNFADDVDVWATLEGGGLTGQADALQLGIARAFVDMDENARHFLRQADLLTRDDRAVERKKINQPGARAKQQVSKR